MLFGACSSLDQAHFYADAGFDFLEANIQNILIPNASDEEFKRRLAEIKNLPLPCLCANCLFPPTMALLGPEFNLDTIKRFVSIIFARCEAAGIRKVVFGSGKARSVQENADRQTAAEQLCELFDGIVPLAQNHGITIILESLNGRETNMISQVATGAALVSRINHPNFRLLADSFHWGQDDNSIEGLFWSVPLLGHVHIATIASRLAPGSEDCDFKPFLRALKRGGYDSTLSIECLWNDPQKEAKSSLEVMRSDWAAV